MAKTIDQIAQEVVKGQWGSGDVRKKKLIAAGYDYETVQKRVNELLKPYQNLNAKNYIKKVEELTNSTVAIFSVGPDRKQTIRLKEIF